MMRHQDLPCSPGTLRLRASVPSSIFYSLAASMAAEIRAAAEPSPAITAGMNHHGGRLRDMAFSPFLTTPFAKGGRSSEGSGRSPGMAGRMTMQRRCTCQRRSMQHHHGKAASRKRQQERCQHRGNTPDARHTRSSAIGACHLDLARGNRRSRLEHDAGRRGIEGGAGGDAGRKTERRQGADKSNENRQA